MMITSSKWPFRVQVTSWNHRETMSTNCDYLLWFKINTKGYITIDLEEMKVKRKHGRDTMRFTFVVGL